MAKKETKKLPRQTRRYFDHEAIGRVYRAGQLSDREIASQFGCSHTLVRNIAKKYGWRKDLSGQVKTAIKSKLVSNISKANTDNEIIEKAAEIGASVVETHRKDIRNLRALEDKLIKEVYGDPTKLYMAQYQGEIIQKEVRLTAAELAQAANNLANVQHKRIQLERQAFGLDTHDGNHEMLVIKPAAICKPDDSGAYKGDD